jgi:hypothetical protein
MKQLHALERWRQMQLETAQTRHAELARHAEQQRALVEYCREQCLAAQDLLRGRLQSSQPLAPAALLRLTQFAALQADEERRQQARLDSVQAAADAAHRVVKDCFEQVSVVQKLAARRHEQLREAYQRRQQRTLDELAAARRAPSRAQHNTTHNFEE